jgi:hypothetical protein
MNNLPFLNENGHPFLFFCRFQRQTDKAAGLVHGQDSDYEGEKHLATNQKYQTRCQPTTVHPQDED